MAGRGSGGGDGDDEIACFAVAGACRQAQGGGEQAEDHIPLVFLKVLVPEFGHAVGILAVSIIKLEQIVVHPLERIGHHMAETHLGRHAEPFPQRRFFNDFIPGRGGGLTRFFFQDRSRIAAAEVFAYLPGDHALRQHPDREPRLPQGLDKRPRIGFAFKQIKTVPVVEGQRQVRGNDGTQGCVGRCVGYFLFRGGFGGFRQCAGEPVGCRVFCVHISHDGHVFPLARLHLAVFYQQPPNAAAESREPDHDGERTHLLCVSKHMKQRADKRQQADPAVYRAEIQQCQPNAAKKPLHGNPSRLRLLYLIRSA